MNITCYGIEFFLDLFGQYVSLPKEDAEDGISAIMSPLIWKNASSFFRDTSRQSHIFYY
jgi:hypothetical protein